MSLLLFDDATSRYGSNPCQLLVIPLTPQVTNAVASRRSRGGLDPRERSLRLAEVCGQLLDLAFERCLLLGETSSSGRLDI